MTMSESHYLNIKDVTSTSSLPYLTARQQAIYSYSCVRWSLLAECDSIQYIDVRLDEDGVLRRAKFLLRSYATSPQRLFPAINQRWS